MATAEGTFYNHRKSINNKTSANNTTLSKYIQALKEAINSNPTPLPRKYHLIQIYLRSVYCGFMQNSK